MDEEKLEPLVVPPDGSGEHASPDAPARSPLDAPPAEAVVDPSWPWPGGDRDTMSPGGEATAPSHQDDDDDATVPTGNVSERGRCMVLRTCLARTPTLALILVPMGLLIIVMFVSAALLPPGAGTVDPESPGGDAERATGRPTGLPTAALPTGRPTAGPAAPGTERDGTRQDLALGAPQARGPREPRGVHISLTGKASEMHVQFITGEGGTPVVQFGRKSDLMTEDWNLDATGMQDQAMTARRTSGLNAMAIVKGTTATYAASDMCQSPASDASDFGEPGHVHTVVLTGLDPGTDYAYRVGLGYGQGVRWEGRYRTFRSSVPGGWRGNNKGEGAVVTFLALSDQGTAASDKPGDEPAAAPAGKSPAASPSAGVRSGAGSSIGSASENEGGKKKKGKEVNLLDPAVRVTNLITSLVSDRTVSSVHHFGDVSYADGITSVWDAYHAMVEPYASSVPVMYGVGNHEYDHTEGGLEKDPSGAGTEDGFQPGWGEGMFESRGGECGVALGTRFAVPDNGNGIFWYSYDQSIVHTVMLSSEHNLTSGSDQYEWLENDLKSVNRTITPWLVVEMHRPMYNSVRYWGGATVALGMRSEFEDLLYEYRVDLVLSGHYHSYLRTCDGLYRGECKSGGPTYVTVGTGGAPLDGDGVGFIPNGWTEVYDNRRHGVGRAGAYNASAMLWEFVAADDDGGSGGGAVTDSVWLRRNRGT